MKNCRGKRIDNNEWVYGWLYQVNNVAYILLAFPTEKYGSGYSMTNGKSLKVSTAFRVIPSSVGQSIGKKDKKRKEIYADDLVKICNLECQLQIFEAIGRVAERYSAWGVTDLRIIKFEKYSPKTKPPDAADMMYFLNMFECKVIEVIGNIHEKSELLETEK